MSGTIRTWSSRHVDPMALTPEDINFRDISVALSNICRYGGHCHRHYSVAEHTIDVFQRVLSCPARSPLDPIYALIHDAPEAFIGDMVSPLKRRMQSFRVIEASIQHVLAEAVGIEYEPFRASIESGLVKRFDEESGTEERSFLWSDRVDPLADWAQPRTNARRLFTLLAVELSSLPGMTEERLQKLGILNAQNYVGL